MPSFSARLFIAGPWLHSAVAKETMVKASAPARSLGALRVPSAAGPWQLAQPRSAKTRSPRKGEPRWFEIAQAGEETEHVRNLLTLQRRRGQASLADMLKHGRSVIPQHRGELRGGPRQFMRGTQFGTNFAALSTDRMALDALRLEDFPTVIGTAA